MQRAIKIVLEKIEEPRGEFVLIIEGAKNTEENKNPLTLEEHYNLYEKQGLDKKEIIKKIAQDRNVHKSEIYKYFLE